jgi:hypothetical protein
VVLSGGTLTGYVDNVSTFALNTALAAYNTLGKLKTAIETHTSWTCASVGTATSSTASAGLVSRARTFINNLPMILTSGTGANDTWLLIGINTDGQCYRGWEDTNTTGSIKTKCDLDMGSDELLKRPLTAYVNGTASTMETLQARGATSLYTFTPPGRANYYPGVMAYDLSGDFQFSLTGISSLRSIKLIAEGVTV